MLPLITLSASLLLSRVHLITSPDLPGRRVGRQVRRDEIYEVVSIKNDHLKEIFVVISGEGLACLDFLFLIRKVCLFVVI